MKMIQKLKQNHARKEYIRENQKKGVIFDPEGYAREDCIFEGNNYVAGKMYACSMGYGSYVQKNSTLLGVKIGRFTAVGENVNLKMFNHPINMVAVTPAFYHAETTLKSFVEKDYFEDMDYSEKPYSVTIGNDVWIGSNAMIKSGVTIGDGAIIGAGSLVTHDVLPYSIVYGIPAKHQKYRFEEDVRSKLLEIRWWDKDEQWLKEYGPYFHDVSRFLDKISEM